MAKFNTTVKARPVVRSPIVTEQRPSGLTYEGAPGYARDAKGELFSLAVVNMVGENTFYEKAGDRDERYENLIHQVAVEDPQWTARFLAWLRSEGNMRSASLVGGVEAARALVAAKVPGGRQIVASVLQRADEPSEALAYYIARYGRTITKPVKRGIADAALRLYAEYPLLKYDTASHGVRFADVLELCHPGDRAGSCQGSLLKGQWQRDLFMHALARRHNREDAVPETLAMVRANQELRELVADEPYVALDADRLRAAGMTWEDVLSLVGSKVDKAKLWEALIPSLGFMAAIRNLRNLDEAGVSDAAVAPLIARLTDPVQVAKSRQFPYRFLAAYENAPSLRWSHPLDTALNLSLSNVPKLTGKTLVLIDTSASMTSQRLSARSTMTAAKAAAVFGVVLGARSGADVYGFAGGHFANRVTFRHDIPKAASVIREIDAFCARTGEVGHGTETAQALRETYRGHDRVFVITDGQAFSDYRGEVTSAVPAHVPMYGVNLGGYKHGMMPTGKGNRHELAGLTDATFRLVPLLERGKDAPWPWESSD